MTNPTDQWKSAYREWAAAAGHLRSLRSRVADIDAGAVAADSFGPEHELRAALAHFEAQAEERLRAMTAMFREVVAARTPPGAQPQPRLSLAVDQLAPGAFRWELIAAFADGAVVTLEKSQITYAERDRARAAGRLAIPPLPTVRLASGADPGSGPG